MKRTLALVLPVALALGGCCSTFQPCPVNPGSPAKPQAPGNLPSRPIVWDVQRNGQVVALAYEPVGAEPWKIVYAEGTLPFRADDVMFDPPELPNGVPYTDQELCTTLRSRMGLMHGTLDMSTGFDLNAIMNPVPCDD